MGKKLVALSFGCALLFAGYGYAHAATSITSCADFEAITNNLSGDYVLSIAGDELDCSGEGNTIMIGTTSTAFTGTFDGGGKSIKIAIIKSSDEVNGMGLFAKTDGATITNLSVSGTITAPNGGPAFNVGGLIGLVSNHCGSVQNSTSSVDIDLSGATQFLTSGAGGLIGNVSGCSSSATWTNLHATGNITGKKSVGGLVGYFSGFSGFSITNATASGAVTGTRCSIGGLFGGSDNVAFSNVHATGNVQGDCDTGGLIGDIADSIVQNAYATGAVTGNSLDVGGLIGYISIATTSNSYATGNVIGDDDVGGLVGYVANTQSQIIRSFASGNVTENQNYRDGYAFGGLVGYIDGDITDSYATGHVDAGSTHLGVGGLVGDHDTGTILNSYATGLVTVDNNPQGAGGLVGENYSTITSSFWDTQTSAQALACGVNGSTACGGATGKATSDMQTASTFTAASWDFASVWNIDSSYNNGYPFFQWQFTPAPAPTPTPTPIFAGGGLPPEPPYVPPFSSTFSGPGGSPAAPAAITGMFATTTATTTATSTLPILPKGLTLSKNYRFLDLADEIRALQQFLNAHGFQLAVSGPGSTGNETTKFGLLTLQAVKKFQMAQNLPNTGFVGPLTRAVLSSF